MSNCSFFSIFAKNEIELVDCTIRAMREGKEVKTGLKRVPNTLFFPVLFYLIKGRDALKSMYDTYNNNFKIKSNLLKDVSCIEDLLAMNLDQLLQQDITKVLKEDLIYLLKEGKLCKSLEKDLMRT